MLLIVICLSTVIVEPIAGIAGALEAITLLMTMMIGFPTWPLSVVMGLAIFGIWIIQLLSALLLAGLSFLVMSGSAGMSNVFLILVLLFVFFLFGLIGIHVRMQIDLSS